VTASGTAGRAATERGFSLLELTIATLVLGVALLLAAQGLLETQRILAGAQRHLASGSTDYAAALLRRDARSARRVFGSSTAWAAGALRLEAAGGDQVEYRLDATALERIRRDPGGALRSRQVVARGVAGFRWQAGAGLLEVELALAPPPPRARVLRRGGAPLFPAPARERITVALRGTPRTWW
jgi:prepilin-type N-terminal cleavage/methylation domain-containing protein